MEEYYEPHLSINHWAEEDRPREKLLQKGRGNLTNAELIGILIGSGTKKLSAVDLGKHILQAVNHDLNALAKLSVTDLKKFKGIGEAKAISIVSALELGRRRKKDNPLTRPKITSSQEAYDVIRPQLMDLQREEFWVMLLDRGNRVLHCRNVSLGGVSATVADPKIIFKQALDDLASSMILVHNHPSGNLKPSQQDINLTEKLVNAGKMLEIPVLDHLIFTNDAYFSFADEGMI